MKKNAIHLLDINIDEFKEKIYPYYVSIFPEDERKPLTLIENACQKGYMKIIKIVNQSDLVGFMILNKIKENGYRWLDYFAILPEYRNEGFGSKSLKILIEKEKESNGIFLEIEKIGLGKDEKENALRQKRKEFYEKIGFQKLNFDLQLFNVIYTSYVFSNIPIDEEKLINEMFDIYETIVGKERIQKNCKVTRNLKFKELNKDTLKIAAQIQYEIFPNSSAYSVYKSKVKGQRNEFYVSYIAYFDNKPVGVIGLYEIPEYRDTVWLSWFGLIEKYRKMGFGKQMLDFIVDVAKKNNRNFLRLYTFETWNSKAQEFYKKNMDLEETYFNGEEKEKRIFEGNPKIFSKSLCSEKVGLWNNKFINISEDEESHQKSVLMMKQDKII